MPWNQTLANNCCTLGCATNLRSNNHSTHAYYRRLQLPFLFETDGQLDAFEVQFVIDVVKFRIVVKNNFELVVRTHVIKQRHSKCLHVPLKFYVLRRELLFDLGQTTQFVTELKCSQDGITRRERNQ